MSKGKGYLLPAGDAYTEEMRCALIFYPDKDEYRRALRGSLDFLGTWVAWERDAAKRGKDAAAAWKIANELTRECIEMACLEQLQADVAAIRQMMSMLGYCCDGSITYVGQPSVPITITPGAGDPPATYGETTISDWEEWSEYVCYNAGAYVDFLIQQAESFADMAGIGTWTLGIIAAGLALLSFTGIGLPVSFALAATVLSGLVGASAGTFDGVADDLETARADIICSIINGTSLSDAIEDAIGSSSAAWLLLFQFVDYDSATAIIQSGGYNGEYLPAETDDSCSCEEPYDVEIVFTFDSDMDNWNSGGANVHWNSTYQCIEARNTYGLVTAVNANTKATVGSIQNGHTYRFVSVTMDAAKNSSAGAGNYIPFAFNGVGYGNIFYYTLWATFPSFSAYTFNVASIPDFTYNGEPHTLMRFDETNGLDTWFDNIVIRLRDIT